MVSLRTRLLNVLLAGTVGLSPLAGAAQTTEPVGDLGNGASLLPTGQTITPTAAPGSSFSRLETGLRTDGTADANGPVKTALSPDGKTLLVLTSGYNYGFRNEQTGQSFTFPVIDPITGQTAFTSVYSEWVFVFDLSTGVPIKQQQISIPDTFNGLVWAPAGDRFYVSGGVDDRVLVYKVNNGQFVPDAPFVLLNHNSNQTSGFPSYDGGLLKGTPAAVAATGGVAAGLDLGRDGKTLVVANFENDSISIVDTASRQVTDEVRFFVPGQQTATGEFPFDVAVYSDLSGRAVKVFVTSQRDDEVLAVDLASRAITRIPVGSQPNKLILTADGRQLYVANGNSDTVSVIDPVTNSVLRTLSLSRPGQVRYKGSNPNALALSPDGRTLYVTLGGENAVAVVNLLTGLVVGRIPTGWYPNSVSVSKDGSKLYVVNAKGNSGPNPSAGRTTTQGRARNTNYRNDYVYALQKGGFSVIPTPNAQSLRNLSAIVDQNNGFDNPRRYPLIDFLRTKIKHVIYVVKENRTYDQVLGDLPVGNGDPELTLFPNAIAPNHHKLALDFVTLDNFYVSGETSGVGWNWSTYARTTDYTEKTQSVLYGNAGFSGLTYDYEGPNRNINNALPELSPTGANPFNSRLTGLLDPSGNSAILPGPKDLSAPEGDGDLESSAIGGFLWDAAVRAGKSVRNYGYYIDLFFYGTAGNPTEPDPNNPNYIPISRQPFAAGIPQGPPSKPTLLERTDIYFRGYDMKVPDTYLYEEWKREFDQYVSNNNLPQLMLVKLPHDHFGDFGQAVAGLNTASLQMADNDYALGKLVETVSKSVYWRDTAIVVIEDDAQNGPDHVDAHRSPAFVISPYTRRGAVVSTNYNTVNILRTVEDLLGIDYLGQFDANARPMVDIFTYQPDYNTYTAVVPGNLCQSPVDPALVPECAAASVPRTQAVALGRDKAWWVSATKGFNFSREDKLDPDAFNRILWQGIRGDSVPYPVARHRQDLRFDRVRLLKEWTARSK